MVRHWRIRVNESKWTLYDKQLRMYLDKKLTCWHKHVSRFIVELLLIHKIVLKPIQTYDLMPRGAVSIIRVLKEFNDFKIRLLEQHCFLPPWYVTSDTSHLIHIKNDVRRYTERYFLVGQKNYTNLRAFNNLLHNGQELKYYFT